MRKTTLILVSLLVIGSLFVGGCGSSTTDTGNPAPTGQNNSGPTKTTGTTTAVNTASTKELVSKAFANVLVPEKDAPIFVGEAANLMPDIPASLAVIICELTTDEAPPESQFLWVYYAARVEGSESANLPAPPLLYYADVQDDEDPLPASQDQTYHGRFLYSGQFTTRSIKYAPGTIEEGWVRYSVPLSIDISQIKLVVQPIAAWRGGTRAFEVAWTLKS